VAPQSKIRYGVIKIFQKIFSKLKNGSVGRPGLPV